MSAAITAIKREKIGKVLFEELTKTNADSYNEFTLKTVIYYDGSVSIKAICSKKDDKKVFKIYEA